MEAGSLTAPRVGSEAGDKGLKKDALGFVSSCVIGVASTAPGYSLAASLGFVVAVGGIGLQAPAVMLRRFCPRRARRSRWRGAGRCRPRSAPCTRAT
jgi:hypothetical protein